MKKYYSLKLIPFLLLFVFTSSYAQQKGISLLSELQKMHDLGNLPQYQSGEVVRQTSSYDTTGNNDDGFSGKYSFVRRNADSSLVIFEASGNGVINRIWTPTPNDDLLDFYFGGANKPAFSIRFSDLFSNKVFPFIGPLCGNQLGGYYCYLPIPFKNGCKVVSRAKKMEFYQIQYRSYPRNTKIENFAMQLKQPETLALQSLQGTWDKIRKQGTALNDRSVLVKHLHADTLLQPGQQVTLAEINSGGRINRLVLSPANAFRGNPKQMDIRITWDDEKIPAIYAPVADFFGFAFGAPSMQSLLLGTEHDSLYLNFPMPFDRKAKIELIYRKSDDAGQQAQKVQMQLSYSNNKRDPQREGKFYGFWNREATTQSGRPHIFAQGMGKGHYVGTILQAQGLKPGMTLFFEGDDQTRIDGRMTMHGTGSEDYFNGGWYALLDRWDTKMSMPLHGSLDYSLPYSRTGGYRLFLSDKLPFEKSFYQDIEHGPENNNKVADYTSVGLYYADKSLSEEVNAPTNSSTRIYTPDTLMLYPQLMSYSLNGNIGIAGNTYTATNGGQLRISLQEIPAGKYKLYADLEQNTDGAEVSLWQRQTLLKDRVSFYSTRKEIKDMTFLTPLEITEFKNTITIQFKPDATRRKVWINRLILVKE
jgi:hypothetical protein